LAGSAGLIKVGISRSAHRNFFRTTLRALKKRQSGSLTTVLRWDSETDALPLNEASSEVAIIQAGGGFKVT